MFAIGFEKVADKKTKAVAEGAKSVGKRLMHDPWFTHSAALTGGIALGEYQPKKKKEA